MVSGVTLVTSILGFFKESIVASFYGLSLELDTFFVALLIPGVINTVFLGSFKSVFIPNYIIELNQKGNIGAFQATSLVVTTVVSVFFVFIAFISTDTFLEILYPNKSLEFYYMVKEQLYILLPAIFLWGMSSVTGALLNVNDEYRLSSFSGIFTPICIVLGIYFFNDYKSNTLLAWGTTIGAFFSVLYLITIASKKKLIILGKVDLKNKNIKIAFKQIPAKISSGFLTAMNSVVDQFFAAQLLVGSIAALNYGLKIPAFTSSLLLVAFSTVLLPYFSKTVINNRKLAFENLFKNLKWLFLGLTIITILGILLSDFVVALLFQRNEFTAEDTHIVSTIQKIFLAYIPFKISGMIMVNFATSINKNSIMAYIALIALILNIILDYILMKFYGVFGIAICTTIVTVIKSLIMYLYLKRLGENIKTSVQ
ncbi:polysaccharide biosynthesis C-terminal domain-containing protein [Maribacter litopenaei]|uniref:Polysaccharide biosynthesis C-terminal domain-containing protein n=1 Tax=Maribacter litopenaei TaxID=2976127 RepID=A0ABY5YB19_9FLAO|nr:lipid II flippase MurJ [Maribacter litopenaei]UWX56104.1 polysaccharide biosynthesis C-terminal domain-containing protein [Maribacter litopenaei]